LVPISFGVPGIDSFISAGAVAAVLRSAGLLAFLIAVAQLVVSVHEPVTALLDLPLHRPG
jgi:hypothetical protein